MQKDFRQTAKERIKVCIPISSPSLSLRLDTMSVNGGRQTAGRFAQQLFSRDPHTPTAGPSRPHRRQLPSKPLAPRRPPIKSASVLRLEDDYPAARGSPSRLPNLTLRANPHLAAQDFQRWITRSGFLDKSPKTLDKGGRLHHGASSRAEQSRGLGSPPRLRGPNGKGWTECGRSFNR